MFPISDSIHRNRFPFFTIAIILFTCFVFFLQLTAANPDAFVATYALIPAHVHFSNVQTLLPFFTAIFLHGGFLHIISNIWFLWIFGDDVEGYLGSIPFLFLYFTAGIIGNVLQYVLMPNSTVPALGASGAIARVLGAYFILFPYSKIKTVVFIFWFFTIINIPAPFMLGYWFVLQVISGFGSFASIGQTGGIAFLPILVDF